MTGERRNLRAVEAANFSSRDNQTGCTTAMTQNSQRIYCLEGIEIDASRMCLKRDGQELHLRQKTFQVLLYLLAQRERLITKNELIDHVWRDTAVTDNALEQCLAEIRKILGDDSRRPRFIKTVPRSGYRFIGAVEERLPSQPVAREIEEAAVVERDPNDSGSRQRQPDNVPALALPAPGARHWIKRRAVLILLVALTIATVAVPAYFIQKRSSLGRPPPSVTLPQVAGKRPVAVMFFDNQSGSADLDWMREGLADMVITDLSRSNKLNLLSRQQLDLLLERIGHKESANIQLDEALEIARRSMATVVILGSFAQIGEKIRIDVHLHDARDGQLLTAERLVVDQPSQILTQVDLLSLRLASHLGASPDQGDMAGLSTVMTNNLEAYRYYSLGVEKASGLHNDEAIALLEKAVALDPEFAMAYARIGYVYVLRSALQEKGSPYLEKAFRLSSRLTEKDKLSISAWYAIAHRDYPGAIKSFQDILARYPLEVEVYARLGELLRGEERFEEAIEVTRQGLIIDSGAKDLYNLLGAIYSQMGRHDEAIAMLKRYVDLAPEEPNAHDSLGMAYQWAGQYQEATSEYGRALFLKPDFQIPIIHLGNAYFQQGRYREAITQYRHYVDIAPLDRDRLRGYSSIAHVQRMRGNVNEADTAAKQAAKYQQAPGYEYPLFLNALYKGDMETAARFKKVLEESRVSERGARASTRTLLDSRGYFELKSGRSAEAIEIFKSAISHRAAIWDIDPYEDCLANAYLELGRFDEAIAEYERVLKLNPNYPLVQYHLAQAYERKGQPDQARASYERFLQVWKSADADVPELISARKALAGMGS